MVRDKMNLIYDVEEENEEDVEEINPYEEVNKGNTDEEIYEVIVLEQESQKDDIAIISCKQCDYDASKSSS